MTPTGIASITIPVNIVKHPNIFPPIVIGTMSPINGQQIF